MQTSLLRTAFFHESPRVDQTDDGLLARLLKIQDKQAERKQRKQAELAIASTVAGAGRRGDLDHEKQAKDGKQSSAPPKADAKANAKALAAVTKQLQTSQAHAKALAASRSEAAQDSFKA